jgi:signal transduction histidine kinase
MVRHAYRNPRLIRFLWHSERIVGLAVIDDGAGMDAAQLRNAMRFGSAERVDHTSLGKFGLGLKLSSFSQARKLTVVSRPDGLTALDAGGDPASLGLRHL